MIPVEADKQYLLSMKHREERTWVQAYLDQEKHVLRHMQGKRTCVAEVHSICNRHGLSLYFVATPTILILHSYSLGRRINGRSPPSSPRGMGLTTAWNEPTRAEEKKEEAISELKVQCLYNFTLNAFRPAFSMEELLVSFFLEKWDLCFNLHPFFSGHSFLAPLRSKEILLVVTHKIIFFFLFFMKTCCDAAKP